MNIRTAAALAIAPVLKKEHSLQSSFELGIVKVEPKDRGLYHELVFGTLRKFELLDHIAKQLLSKKLKNKDLDVYALVLLGLYQLAFLRTPDHAAISETVAATKGLKKIWAKNLVNAILRNFQRKQSELLKQAELEPSSQKCLPTWLLKELQSQWPNYLEQICKSAQTVAPLTARINLNRVNLQDAISKMDTQELRAEPCEYSSLGLNILGSTDVTSLPGFEEGWLSIQDEAAQLSSSLLGLKPDQRVLDACAAPGGKTAAILESEPSLTEVLALEIDEDRVPRINENLNRLKLRANVYTADAGDLDSWWDGTFFDRILLDAPCSATGVIRRHPDIKLLRREEDLCELAATQKLLLNRLWQTLKPGGILLYATCSILKNENEEQIAAFINDHDDVTELPIEADWGIKRPFGRQLFPKTSGHDGFYYAKLLKS